MILLAFMNDIGLDFIFCATTTKALYIKITISRRREPVPCHSLIAIKPWQTRNVYYRNVALGNVPSLMLSFFVSFYQSFLNTSGSSSVRGCMIISI